MLGPTSIQTVQLVKVLQINCPSREPGDSFPCMLVSKGDSDLSHDMRFPTMWYVRPAKPQISLRIRAV